MCQDWFHDTCILKDYPHTIPDEPDTDFICKDCISKFQSFLGKYKNLEYIEPEEEKTDKTEQTINILEPLEKHPKEQNDCLISKESSTNFSRAGNYFFRPGWRENLCRCRKCLNMYQLINVNYLIQDEEKTPETPLHPPSTTVKNPKPDLEDPINSLSRQREIAYGIMEFRDNLMEFLKPFAAQKRTVTAADIELFKEQFQNQKKKKKI
jgi:E3 ubiquitin-protein ligase UBR7